MKLTEKTRKRGDKMLKAMILLPLFVLTFPMSLHSGHFFIPATELRSPIPLPEYSFIGNISWYTASADECGGKDDGITASGTVACAGRTVACDHLPFGTRIRINGKEYIVEDRFGGGYTDRVDIFCETKDEAFENGRQRLVVEVLKEG